MTPRIKNLLLIATSSLTARLIFEACGRMLLRPNDQAFGTLLGVTLPPIRLFNTERLLEARRDAPYRDIVVDGRKITVGDL